MRKRILVYQVGSVGDTVVTIPSLHAVRKHFGFGSEIVLLHERRSGISVTPADLLEGGAEVDRFLSYECVDGVLRKFIVFSALYRCIRREKFSAIVYLVPGERPEANVRRDKWFFSICGIPTRIGFHAFPTFALYPKDKDGYPKSVMHEAFWRLERIRRDGVEIPVMSELVVPFLRIPSEDTASAYNWLGLRRRCPDQLLVGICPGAKQTANIWPLDRFGEIGKRLTALNRYELVVVGGEGERKAGDQLVAFWGSGVNAAGQLTLKESAAVLGSCAFVVGLDTGTTHLAAAIGVRCVGLYGGREHPGRWDPIGTGHIVLRNKVPCAGCMLRDCPVEGHPCMTGIDLEEVWRAILQVAGENGK